MSSKNQIISCYKNLSAFEKISLYIFILLLLLLLLLLVLIIPVGMFFTETTGVFWTAISGIGACVAACAAVYTANQAKTIADNQIQTDVNRYTNEWCQSANNDINKIPDIRINLGNVLAYIPFSPQFYTLNFFFPTPKTQDAPDMEKNTPCFLSDNLIKKQIYKILETIVMDKKFLYPKARMQPDFINYTANLICLLPPEEREHLIQNWEMPSNSLHKKIIEIKDNNIVEKIGNIKNEYDKFHEYHSSIRSFLSLRERDFNRIQQNILSESVYQSYFKKDLISEREMICIAIQTLPDIKEFLITDYPVIMNVYLSSQDECTNVLPPY